MAANTGSVVGSDSQSKYSDEFFDFVVESLTKDVPSTRSQVESLTKDIPSTKSQVEEREKEMLEPMC